MENIPPKSIGFEINHLAIIIRHAFDKQILDEDNFDNQANLTIIQSHIIDFTYNHENHTISQSELEKEFSRRRSTITGILKLMEKNGFITREYSKKDARVKIVTLTEKAIQLHHEITTRINAFNQNLEKGLTDDEIKTFYSIMDKIKKNLV